LKRVDNRRIPAELMEELVMREDISVDEGTLLALLVDWAAARGTLDGEEGELHLLARMLKHLRTPLVPPSDLLPLKKAGLISVDEFLEAVLFHDASMRRELDEGALARDLRLKRRKGRRAMQGK
jgi:hypothetical protein